MERVVRLKVWWLLLAVVLFGLFWGPSNRLTLDESIESFFAPSDPLLQAYQTTKKSFGGDEFVLVGYQLEDPTDSDELRRQKELAEQLSAVPGVKSSSTQSLADTLRNPRAEGLIRLAMRLPMTRSRLMDLSRRVLIGDDDKTVCIILRLLPEEETNVSRVQTFAEIRRIANNSDPPAVVAGEPIQVHDMFRYVEDDSWLLGWVSSTLLMLVILIMFRNLRWVVLPIVVIQLVLVLTRGLLYFAHIQLSMVSSMLTSLVTIICIATVMHIVVTYREKRLAKDRYDAFVETIQLLAPPIFWTCLTTAIGFASLLSSDITPVRSFGLMMAVGTLFVPVVCVLVLPGGALIGNFQAEPFAPPEEKRLLKSLDQLAKRVNKSGRTILAVGLLIAVFAGCGLVGLRVETDFSTNFRKSSPIVQALHFFETNLGGVGSWEIGFSAPPELNEEHLEKVRELAEELREVKLPDGTGLTKVVALTDGLDLVPKIPMAERGFLRLPRLRWATLEERQELVDSLQPEMLPSLYDRKAGRMRIMLRALEQQPAEVKLKLIERVEEVAQGYFPEAKATGLYVLLANLISSLLADQIVSFGLAATGVAITMGIAFRSFWVGLISLIPNVLPILLVVGGMGWANVPINIGTAMIASVSMGLTVDSTIHYLTAYRRSRVLGAPHELAVEAAHASVGLALVLANIALITGFAALALSHFIPLVYFGVLVSAAMVGGLLGNLILLPPLLKWIPFSRKPAIASTPVDQTGDPVHPESA